MTDKGMSCPTCGQVLTGHNIDAVLPALRPLERRIISAIHDAPGITTEALIKATYRRQPKPKDPANSIRVALYHSRPVLRQAGWAVKGSKANGYRLLREGAGE